LSDAKLNPADRPCLVQHAHAKTDRHTGERVLLYPERALILSRSAAQIVELCTGEHTLSEIAQRCAEQHPETGFDEVFGDVCEFVQELVTRSLIRMGASRPAPATPSPELAHSTLEKDEPHRPYTLVAELTYACPLRCAYCSNPTDFDKHVAALSTADWQRAIREAEALGILHVNFTGGEPLLRKDLEALVGAAKDVGLYVNLITSGIPLERARLLALRDAGLSHVQLSIQDLIESDAQAIAGRSMLSEKLRVAEWVKEAGLALTLNFVLHRTNIERIAEFIALAETLAADRVELAHVQYLGWALLNRAALLPTFEQLENARSLAAQAYARLRGRVDLVHVMPDYYTGLPRACMDGWGNRYLVVSPDGFMRPCHAAQNLGLESWNVRTRSVSEIWRSSPIFKAFRGDDWMLEPCRSCPRKGVDFGGCRCQAHALTGNAREADPACALAPQHALVKNARLLVKPDVSELKLRTRHDKPVSA
jgi:PqqA peptide cyclase